ncbi:MAG: PTS sugar transporter subunit IIA [Desulfobacterales bacterium]|nr:PTS sugar transporter subunit IIA [Desulfobacterales bacterium]
MNDFFKKELIVIDLDVDNSEEAIKYLGDILNKGGYVKESFVKAVIAREKEFATGIPTEPLGIAIPHTDGIHVIKMAVAVGVLRKPIKFGIMGGYGEIDIDLVFLMALMDCESQISMLQSFCEFFQRSREIEKIRNAIDKDIILEILNSELEIHSI